MRKKEDRILRKPIGISVIVPDYNDEEHLRACLYSVCEHQDFGDVEVICVDDGSEDDSRAIMEDFEGRYDQVSIVTQRHGGLSVARNVGITAARGKYIYFVDSDDLVEAGMLGHVYEICKKHELDALFFSFNDFADSDVIVRKVQRTHPFR